MQEFCQTCISLTYLWNCSSTFCSTYFLLNIAWKFFKYFVCFFYECWLIHVFVFRNDYWRVICRCPGCFFNSGFKFADMFSLFIPLYTSFTIDESICSFLSSHLRSITSFLHPYLHLTKPAQDCRSFSNLFFWYCGNV